MHAQVLTMMLCFWVSFGVHAQNPVPKKSTAPTSTAPTNKPPNPPKNDGKTSLPAPVNAKATTVKDTAILNLFEKPSDIKWVRYFRGRMDDAAVLDIALGFDGRSCRGYMTYTNSKTRFKLLGTLDTAGFFFEERDKSGSLTGLLRGSLSNRRIEAEWMNAGNTIGGRLEAEELMPGQQSPTLNCSDNKWSSRYITRYNGARCDMVLVRSHNGALDGFLWVESDGRTYRLKGDLKPNGDYEMEALGAGDRLAALLSGKLKPGQNTECNWVGSGERRSFKFVLKDHFLLGCYEYADYATSYDVLYPRTPCPHCNTQLDERVNQWIERCQQQMKQKLPQQTAANRSSQRASAWPEIACWTDNVFAGYITFADTWTEQAQGISFNFDLKTNKEFVLDDLFNKGFNAQKHLSDWANKEMPKLPGFATDPKYREWLTKEGFPLFVLRRGGLEISTLFHPQYGRQTLLVPYAGLKQYMKKDGPAAEFLK